MRQRLECLNTMMLNTQLLTGGPVSGRSAFVRQVEPKQSSLNRRMIFLPNAEAELMKRGGLSAADLHALSHTKREAYYQFYLAAANYQIASEEMAAHLARRVNLGQQTVTVANQGIPDMLVKLPFPQPFRLLSEQRLHSAQISWRYSTICHLVSTAVDAQAIYSQADRELSPSDAVAADQATLQSYAGHPHIEIFRNDAGLDQKFDNVLGRLTRSAAGEDTQVYERKWLLSMPPTAESLRFLQAVPVRLRQYHLEKQDGVRVRHREWGGNDGAVYIRTSIRQIGSGISQESERRITVQDFLRGTTLRDRKLTIVDKTRWCFFYDYQYFWLDQYNVPSERGWVLRLRIDDAARAVTFPPHWNLTEITGGIERASLSPSAA